MANTFEIVNPNDSQGLPAWLANPIEISSKSTSSCAVVDEADLTLHSKERLKALSIENLFQVQSAVIKLMKSSSGDICVSAPTGSGKTLAYVIPVVQYLKERIIPRIRALVIVPTRELAIQVKATFESFVKGTDLRVGCLTAQTSFASEQAMLVSSNDVLTESCCASSKIDILISTPGKLKAHLDGTAGFTLQHLRFLVIDEADRLLNQKYHDWISNVLEATKSRAASARYDPISKLPLHNVKTMREFSRLDVLKKETRLQKLLFSATLSRNPGKIASLALYEPKYISVSSQECIDNQLQFRFVAPPKLLERFVIVETPFLKPVILLQLLKRLDATGILIFTKSVESAHRLAALLNIQTKSSNFAKAFSSTLIMSDRKRLLSQFKASAIKCLVCSDVMSRGIDLGSSVEYVICYDIPSNTQSYVHRIGRTARAEREGVAYSILERDQVKWFKNEIASFVGRSNPLVKEKVTFSDDDIPLYKEALLAVERMVKKSFDTSLIIKKNEDTISHYSSDSEMEDVFREKIVNPIEEILMGIQVGKAKCIS